MYDATICVPVLKLSSHSVDVITVDSEGLTHIALFTRSNGWEGVSNLNGKRAHYPLPYTVISWMPIPVNDNASDHEG